MVQLVTSLKNLFSGGSSCRSRTGGKKARKTKKRKSIKKQKNKKQKKTKGGWGGAVVAYDVYSKEKK